MTQWLYDELASQGFWVRFLFCYSHYWWASSFCRLSCVFGCPLTSFIREKLLDQYWPLYSTCNWNWKQKQKTKLDQYVSDNLELYNKRPTGLKGHLNVRNSTLRPCRLSTSKNTEKQKTYRQNLFIPLLMLFKFDLNQYAPGFSLTINTPLYLRPMHP